MLVNSLPQYKLKTNIQCSLNTNRATSLCLKPQLANDTVAFCAKMPKYDNTFFMDALSRGYDTAEQSLITKAKAFHGALKRVAEKLKAFGFEYDELYNSASPIKKKKSFLDKYERQGSALDIIRGTIYWQDQQDVIAFRKFIDEMKNEGWIISPKRLLDLENGGFAKNDNKKISIPDLEIRQNGITKETLAPLGEYIQRAEISKPRESTYADWQVRFISTKDKNRQNCEVIFLYGPKYKDAKEIEHKYVYEPIRKMKKLHVDMNTDHHPKGSAGYSIAFNFNEIQKRLVQFISQPLYENAFNADLKIKDVEKLPVEISKNYANLIKNYVRGISKLLPSYYVQIRRELLKNEQVIDSVKSSPSYLFKKDKVITSQEIKDARREIRERLSSWEEADCEKIDEIIADINQTIEKFVVKD